MIKSVVALAAVLALTGGVVDKCNTGTGNGGNPPPGRVYACDTRASKPRLDTTNYPVAVVVGHVNSMCDKQPKSHQIVVKLYHIEKGQWALYLPAQNGAIGGTCFTGIDSPGGKRPGDCELAEPCKDGDWKISADASGKGPAPDFVPFNWTLPETEQVVATITCPKVPVQRKT